MEDCYARLYFISAAGERCEIMLSEREMLVNPITDGKTARSMSCIPEVRS